MLKVFLAISMLLILYLIGILYARKKQIEALTSQIQERAAYNTKQKLFLPLWGRDFLALAKAINSELGRLNEMSSQVFKADQELKATVANISHDLRTPLTSVMGYLELLERDNLTEKQLEIVDIALGKARSLQNLIDGFFELSLLEGSEMGPDWEKLNLNNAVMDCIVELAAEFEAYRCVPVFSQSEEKIHILVDKNMFRRILQNLFVNGMRYGCGELEIEVEAKDKPVLIVRNRVPEPKKIEAERIWDRFYTASLVRGEGSGSGLGLPIVKLLVKKINASVKVDLKDDIFSVRITFPPFA